MAREDGVAQAVVDLDAAYALALDELLGAGYGVFDVEAVEVEAVAARVDDASFFGVVALLAHVAPFDEGDDGQVEGACKGVVAAVVRGHCHYGAGAVAGQHVVAYPDGYGLAGERVDGVGTAEDAGHAAVGHALALGALACGFEVGFDFGTALGRGQAGHPFALGRQHHEGDAEDGVGSGGEDGYGFVAALDAELHFGAFGAAYPVALGLFERVGPVKAVEAVEQALCVGRHAQAPLPHHFLHHGEAAAHRHAVHHLVVGQHGPQLGAPVDHGVAQVGYAVVHQRLAAGVGVHGFPLVGREAELGAACHVEVGRAAPVEVGLKVGYGHGAACAVAVVALEHADERPLRPLVVARVAGAHLAVPVVAEAYLVELLAIARNVLVGGHGRMLARLDGILLGRQTVGVVAHGVQHVEAVEPLETAVDVGGYVSERMTHVQPRTRRVGEHVEHVELGARRVDLHLIYFVLYPIFFPSAFDVLEVVFLGHDVLK